MTSILKVLGALVLAIVAVGAALLIGMRAKFTPVVNAVKQVNKRFLNPMQMKTAGQPGAYAGIIEHVGRTSGKHYETPIGPFPIHDGFLVALPYGIVTRLAQERDGGGPRHHPATKVGPTPSTSPRSISIDSECSTSSRRMSNAS